MADLIRAFIAIPISDEIRQRITRFYMETRLDRNSHLRVVKPAILHLTLKFLGDTSPDILEKVRQRLASIALTTPAFRIHLQRIGAFPGWRNPRVIWAGVEAPPDLTSLAQRIGEEMSALGFDSEGRGFTPHLTLARVNTRSGAIPDLQSLMNQPAPDFGSMIVNGVSLIRSDLRPSGPVYTVLSAHPFFSSES